VPYSLFFLFKRKEVLPAAPVVKFFVLIALLTFPEILVDRFVNFFWIQTLVDYISTYLQLFIFSSLGIWIQETLLKNGNE